MKFLGANKKKGFTPHLLRRKKRIRIYNLKKNGGFTLVELLVSIFIIGFLSSILIVNWRKNEKQYQLQRVTQGIVQNIRKTQEMSLTGLKYFDSQDGTYKIPFNYGLDFNLSNPTSYIIFANKSNDKRYDAGTDSIVDGSAVQIESGFEISSLTGSVGALTIADATFSIPDGFTTIRKDQPSGGAVFQNFLNITIRKVGTTCPSKNCKSIIINQTGQINIQ